MHVSNGSHEEEEEFDFGEVLVHQVCTLLQALSTAVRGSRPASRS